MNKCEWPKIGKWQNGGKCPDEWYWSKLAKRKGDISGQNRQKTVWRSAFLLKNTLLQTAFRRFCSLDRLLSLVTWLIPIHFKERRTNFVKQLHGRIKKQFSSEKDQTIFALLHRCSTYLKSASYSYIFSRSLVLLFFFFFSENCSMKEHMSKPKPLMMLSLFCCSTQILDIMVFFNMFSNFHQYIFWLLHLA